jgi:hypothetical protein
MSATSSLTDIRNAHRSRDPELPRLIIALANSTDKELPPAPDGSQPFAELQRTVTSWRFKKKPRAEQIHFRQTRMDQLEQSDAPRPERLDLWTIILELWQANGPYERSCLLEVIANAPLRWGIWRALKRIFKESEKSGDTEIYGAIAARIDQAYQNFPTGEVTRATLSYLRRRAWRSLRKSAQSLPATYADASVDVLRAYNNISDYQWRFLWISSHIWFHDGKRYSRERFRLPWRLPSTTKERAFSELWKRTPRPLFNLLERARSDFVRRYAIEALKLDFRASLRDIEPAWVRRLIGRQSETIDEFVVWLLSNVPRFEQSAFRSLELHEPVISLLSSDNAEARKYAADYARTHARDLPTDLILRLVASSDNAVRQLAVDLLQDRDPREQIGLDAWGRLLEVPAGFDLASKALRSHFGARELTPDWLLERLLSKNSKVFDFAAERLKTIHGLDTIPAAFFQNLLEDPRVHEHQLHRVVQLAFEGLARFETSQLNTDVLRRALLNPISRTPLQDWLAKGKTSARDLGLIYFKSLSFQSDWKQSPWINQLLETPPKWAEKLNFNHDLARFAFERLADDRVFSPQELGRDWLLSIVDDTQASIQPQAEAYLVKHFHPADFASHSLDGNDALWAMAIVEGDETPRARFALRYIKAHHPMNAKDWKTSPQAVIPESAFNFDRFKILFGDARPRVRAYAIELARWDFRRWSPPTSELVALCEAPYSDVFNFISEALLAEDKEEFARFRLDPATLTPDDAYRFVESLDKPTRDLGLKLIARDPRLADPRELFRLTQSPDRQVQAFVIRTIWSLYRARGTTPHWQPTAPKGTAPTPLPQRPESWPASPQALLDVLRQSLFTIAPGRLPASAKAVRANEGPRLKPLPARKAKIALIEVIRDLSLTDLEFARLTTPLLQEFMGSRGQSEHDACLLALTRIRKAHPLEIRQ